MWRILELLAGARSTMRKNPVERIEVFTRWTGFGDPHHAEAKLVIRREGGRFVREQALAGPADEVPADRVLRLLKALAAPRVPQLDPALFDGLSEPVLRNHYESVWSSDYPDLLVRIGFSTGRVVTLRTDSQHAFMLPLTVEDSAAPEVRETFDPRLSRAIAALLPEEYFGKARLAGDHGLLRHDLDEYARGRERPAALEPTTSMNPEAREMAEAFLDLLNPAEDGPADADAAGPIADEPAPEECPPVERAGDLFTRLVLHPSPGVMRAMLERGADPSVADEVGQTALMYASGDRKQFRLLVQAGADVNARRNDGRTGLHLACGGGMTDEAEEWLKAGADVHARTPEGATPLMLAAPWEPIVRLLLAAGAEVDAADDEGHTPLVYAIDKQSWHNAAGRLEAMRALIAAGADVNREDHRRVTPLRHARRVLARVELEEEVDRAFARRAGSSPKKEWDDRRMAEAVVELIAASGGRE